MLNVHYIIIFCVMTERDVNTNAIWSNQIQGGDSLRWKASIGIHEHNVSFDHTSLGTFCLRAASHCCKILMKPNIFMYSCIKNIYLQWKGTSPARATQYIQPLYIQPVQPYNQYNITMTSHNPPYMVKSCAPSNFDMSFSWTFRLSQ